jgi:hypothetical protein
MKTKKKDDILRSTYKIHRVKSGSKFAQLLAKDPYFIKKREDCIKSMQENPPPEWILKRMRGED